MLVWQGKPVFHRDGSIDWRLPNSFGELADEWVLRQLVDCDLDDDADLKGLLAESGMLSAHFFAAGWIDPKAISRLASDDEKLGRLEDARWFLKTARALVGMWREAGNGEDALVKVWDVEGFLGHGPESVWIWFAVALGEGLRPFHARAEHVPEPPLDALSFGIPRVGLYSAACRQVFNLLVTDATPRTCENETCRRTFVHQVGGSRSGQFHTKGLRFCSPACAKAETQRQYRRREAAKRGSQP